MTIEKFKFIIFIYTMLLTAISSSEESFDLQKKSLNDCFLASLKRTTSIAISEELINQANATYDIAVGTSLPNISGIKTLGWPKAPPGRTRYSSPNAVVESNTKLMVTQPLFQGLKEFSAQRQARALIRAFEFDKKHSALQLYQQVVLSFYTTISLEVDIENANEEFSHYQKRIKELEEFIRIGRSQLTDKLTTASQAQALAAQIKQLSGALKSQRALLSYLTGFDQNVSLKRPSKNSSIERSLDDYLNNINTRPDVEANAQRKESFEEAVSLARGNYWPSLDLQGDYFIERNGIYKSDWDVILNFTIPIFNWGSTKAQVNDSISKRTQATLQLTETKRQAELQIRRFFETYIGDRDQYLGFIEATKSAEKVFEADRRDYKKGLVTNLDVLQALITFQESKRARDRSFYSMLSDLELVESSGGFRKIPEL